MGYTGVRRVLLAEGVGFEPTFPCGIPVFKTGALVHSATPPLGPDILVAGHPRARQPAGGVTITGERSMDFHPP